MPAQKVSKKLPKRTTNAHRKERRARAWAARQAVKERNIVHQKSRERHNAEVGSTGKQRRYNPKYKETE